MQYVLFLKMKTKNILNLREKANLLSLFYDGLSYPFRIKGIKMVNIELLTLIIL